MSVARFLDGWIPGRINEGASTDAPELRKLLCKFGRHSPYFRYGTETFLTWPEIAVGVRKPELVHLGWFCRCCGERIEKRVLGCPPHSSLWLKLRRWVVW